MLIPFLQSVNLGIRFLLEAAIIISFGYWGFKTGSTTILKYMLGLGAPLIAMFVWGTFGSPGASVPLNGWQLLLLEIVLLGLAVAALFASHLPKPALGLAIIFILNRILMAVWGQ